MSRERWSAGSPPATHPLFVILVLLGATAAAASTGAAQETDRGTGREVVEALTFPPLRFDPPEPVEYRLSGGVTVFHLQDSSLPLVDIHARFGGGYGRFPRSHHAAGMALPSLLRNGGTRGLNPDSVDHLMEHYALQTTFGGSGESVTATLNTLTEHLAPALELWTALLREPRFDTAEIAVWRGREMENVLRRQDDPGRLAFSEFNRLLYGDHPVGWEMGVDDLAPGKLDPERLHWLHRRIVCPGNLVLGVTGDVAWADVEPLLEEMLRGWTPCPEPLPEAPGVEVGAEPGVYLIPRPVNQSTVVMAHPVSLKQGDTREYFASRIGNAILGASGLTSRLLSRIRTREGLAYGASSLWTTPRRYDGLVGATTRTRSETTVEAVTLILETMEEMTRAPPTEEEVGTTVDETVNGWVFNFESPAGIVARTIALRASGLDDDWFQAYLEGIRLVEPEDVMDVFNRYLDPSAMVILVVGDPDRMTIPLETLGPVTVLEVEAVRPIPSGAPRSPR